MTHQLHCGWKVDQPRPVAQSMHGAYTYVTEDEVVNVISTFYDVGLQFCVVAAAVAFAVSSFAGRRLRLFAINH